MTFTNKVKRYVHEHRLLSDGQKVTVALSGGPDSVALLHCMIALGYEVHAAHCNFHLRGEESGRDEEFVRNLCERLRVPLCIEHFDTKTYSGQTGKSIEMAARDLRYKWFATLSDTIAVGHHSDDQAETFLLNLVRGSGLRGLTGMSPRSISRQTTDNGRVVNLVVIRPFLCVGRAEVLEYLKQAGEPYVTDSTNNEDDCRRNIIRHHVIPCLQQLNPRVADTISETCERLAESDNLLRAAMKSTLKECMDGDKIKMNALMSTPAPLSVLHEILSPRGYNASQIKRIINERGGQPGQVYLSDKWRLLRDRGCWILSPKEKEKPKCSMTMHCYPASEYKLTGDPSVAAFDIAKIGDSLILRNAQPGDRFTPFGMSGSRLVSDFLTDLHVNLFEREQQMVLVSDDEIAWVVGRRISRKFAITPATQTVLEVRVV